MSILLFHPTGNEFVRQSAYGLYRSRLLSEFHVGLAVFPDSMLDKIAGVKCLSEMRRRRVDNELKQITTSYTLRELFRMLAVKTKSNVLNNSKLSPFNINNFARNFDQLIAKKLQRENSTNITAVYGYEDCAQLTFHSAKRLGIRRIYDLPIGYWRSMHEILELERQKWPTWSGTMPSLKDAEEKLARKDQELHESDDIIVASSFTAETLAKFPGNLPKPKIVPYGFPPINVQARTRKFFHGNSALKLLYVGSLSQRKGVANIFAAVDKLKNAVKLTLIGNRMNEDCSSLNKNLTKHTWIPSLPNYKVLEIMRNHDVLIFPSLFEGFGMVISEAMSQGTPVITTERTGGKDFIKSGINGWLIEAGSTEALINAIEEILHRPQILPEVGEQALLTAANRPWVIYGEELSATLCNKRSLDF